MSLFGNLFGTRRAGDRPSIQEIDAITARQWHQSGECVLIDIREDREFRVERIPGAQLGPCRVLSDRCHRCLRAPKRCSCVRAAAAPGCRPVASPLVGSARPTSSEVVL